MKFLVVFVQDEEDASAAAEVLREQKFQFTILQSAGGFLQNASRTFLMGLSEERLEDCLEIFQKNCKSRVVGAPGSFRAGEPVKKGDFREKYRPATVEVGGAVAFLLDAEHVL